MFTGTLHFLMVSHICFHTVLPSPQIPKLGLKLYLLKIQPVHIIFSQGIEITSGSCAAANKGVMGHCYHICFHCGSKDKPWFSNFTILQWSQPDRSLCEIFHKILKGTWSQTQLKFQLDEPAGKIKEDTKVKGRGWRGGRVYVCNASIFPSNLCQFDFWQTQVEIIIAFYSTPKLWDISLCYFSAFIITLLAERPQ